MDIVSKSNVASLAFLAYDIMLTFSDEVEVVWSKPNHSWVKWQFLFTRYFALALQVCNRLVEMAITREYPLANQSLKMWFICQMVAGIILMIGVEVILMARVYALYNKNSRVAFAFVFLLGAEALAIIMGIVLTFPGDKREFQPETLLLDIPNAFTYYGVTAIVSEIAILGLTIRKYSIAVLDGWSEAPIMSLMMRDGAFAFMALFVLSLGTVVATILESMYAPIGYFWFLSVAATAGCRLIINLERLPLHDFLTPVTPTQELTSAYSESIISSHESWPSH